MPREWTPEARAALGERMKALRAAKKANGQSTPEPGPEAVAPTPVLNPIATDVVAAPRKKPPSRPKPGVVTVAPAEPSIADLAVSYLIKGLEEIPLESSTYDECGQLLNALSAASTRVALARRQKQEQLEAGTHRAPCKTCGRMIDISKPGGFQILTERDEHWMPKNSYYCSQNCLLARNMPSHAKQTPREKRTNQA